MKIKYGRALTRAFAVVAAAGVFMFVGLGSAGAWNVTDSLASVSNVKLNGVLVSDVTVAHGSTITIKFKWALAANTGFPHCDEVIQLGFANQNPDQCVGGNNILTQGGAVSGKWKFTEVAPSTPGSYFLAFAFDEDFACNASGPGWASGPPNPQTQYFAHVTVT